MRNPRKLGTFRSKGEREKTPPSRVAPDNRNALAWSAQFEDTMLTNDEVKEVAGKIIDVLKHETRESDSKSMMIVLAVVLFRVAGFIMDTMSYDECIERLDSFHMGVNMMYQLMAKRNGMTAEERKEFDK